MTSKVAATKVYGMILINDVQGYKLKSALMKLFLGAHSPVQVLRGELLVEINEKNDHFNYRLYRDSSVCMFCTADDVAPLLFDEFHLLEPIKSPADTLHVFSNKLDWGLKLKPGSSVNAILKGSNHSEETQAPAVVHYKGPIIANQAGVFFGVEVSCDNKDASKFGATDGTFQDKRYFLCEDGCGLFLSLEAISPLPKSVDSSSGKSTYKSKLTSDLSTNPPQFSIGQRVSFRDCHSVKHYGTVQWTGRGTATRTFDYNIVGIHTDDSILNGDYDGSLPEFGYHMKSFPKNHVLLLPETYIDPVPGETTAGGDDKDCEGGQEIIKLLQRIKELEKMLDEQSAEHVAVIKKLDGIVESKEALLAAKGLEVEAIKKSKDNELRAKSSQVTAKESEIVALEKQLQAKEKEIEARCNQNEAKDEEIKAKAILLDAKNEEIQAKDNLLAKQIKFREGEVQVQASIIEANVKKIEGHINELQKRKDEYDMLCSQMKSQIKCKDDEIKAKDIEIMSKGKELAAKDDELRAKEELIQAKDIELGAKIEEVRVTKAEITSKEKLITELRSQNEIKIGQMKAEIKEKSDEIAVSNSVIQQKNDELSRLQKKLETEIDLSVPASSWSITRAKVSEIPKKQIGSGAWGLVYSATFKGENVAIKQAHQDLLHTSTVDMLKREIMIMAHIQHPNLVRFIGAVLDSAVERGTNTPIIISELMDMNLRVAYKQQDLSSCHTSIFCDVAYALHYLHQHRPSIIHRDVSAPNVLLKALPHGGYRAKVSDFGSANLAKQSKTAGAGAIVYCAPEMFPSEDVTKPPQPQTTKVDVFSYGVLLLEVVVREMPAPESRYTLLQRVKSQWNFIYELVVHCMKPSPSDRPAMADILNKLNQSHH